MSNSRRLKTASQDTDIPARWSTKAAVAGAVGGLAGTLAMNYAQRLWTFVVDRNPPSSAAGPHDARDWQERSENQNSNEMAAQVLACATINRLLSARELSIAAPIIHFSFGAAAGALYGAYLDTVSERRGSGPALGAALWLTADEIAMPLLGLSRSTLRRPLEMHCQSFVAHLVYGVVAERVRQATHHALRQPSR
jgi:uncharacterized membrane protein YagU involved in acid resistance